MPTDRDNIPKEEAESQKEEESSRSAPRLKGGSPSRVGERRPRIEEKSDDLTDRKTATALRNFPDEVFHIEEEEPPRNNEETIVVGMPENYPQSSSPQFDWSNLEPLFVGVLSKIQGDAQAQRLISRTISKNGTPSNAQECEVIVNAIADRIKDRVRRDTIQNELMSLIKN